MIHEVAFSLVESKRESVAMFGSLAREWRLELKHMREKRERASLNRVNASCGALLGLA